MELLVATWSARLALIGALTVGGLSLSVGASPLDAVVRAAAAAFAFTLGGRVLLARLETPDQRVRRLRARRAAKASTKMSSGKGRPVETEAA